MKSKHLSIKDLDVVQTNSRDVVIGLEGKKVIEFNGSNFRAFYSTSNIQSNNGVVITHHHRKKNFFGHRLLQMEQKEKFIQFKGHFDDPDDTLFLVKIWVENNEVHMRLENEKYDEIGIAIFCPSSERVMGFGTQFRYLDISNHAFELLAEPHGIGKGNQPITSIDNFISTESNNYITSSPMPLYLTSGGQCAFFFEKTIYWFNVQVDRLDQIIASAKTKCLTCCLIQADSMLEAMKRQTAITGRIHSIPTSAYKPIIKLQGDKEKIDKIIQRVTSLGVQLGAIQLEDWKQFFNTKQSYSDLNLWIKKLNEKNIKVLTHHSCLIPLKDNPSILENKKHLVLNEKGEICKTSIWSHPDKKYAQVNLINQDTYNWYKRQLKEEITKTGFNGWTIEDGEFFPVENNTMNPQTFHSRCFTPYLWLKLNDELNKELNDESHCLTISNFGTLFGNQVNQIYIIANQNPTFDKYNGMKSSINALLTSGISGMAVVGTDIGGSNTFISPLYKLNRDKEILFRWLDYASLTPIFKISDTSRDSSLNYQFYDDEEGYNYFARCAKVHCQLTFYFKELEKIDINNGWPMCRALCLHYPNDEKVYYIHHQFLLGTDLLVFPVCAKKAKNVSVYIPGDKWIDPYTLKEYTHGEYRIPSPLGQFPVLIKSDSPHFDKFLDIFTHN